MADDRIRKFRKRLAEAPNYEAWKAAALELDFLEGRTDWKEDFASDLYHYELVYDRLSNLRHYRQQKDADRLKRALREGLHHDLGNMGNRALYSRSRVGTKHLIEEYITQVCESLDYLCDTADPNFPNIEKLQFFRDTLTSFGRPALLLSGGASLGMFHFGVIKALWEKGLLPQVVAGSSIGAIIAGILGVHSDAEIPDMLVPENHNLKAWKWRGLLSAVRGDGLMDQQTLKACLRENIGEYTFEEAFQRSGRSINECQRFAGTGPPAGATAVRLYFALSSGMERGSGQRGGAGHLPAGDADEKRHCRQCTALHVAPEICGRLGGQRPANRAAHAPLRREFHHCQPDQPPRCAFPEPPRPG